MTDLNFDATNVKPGSSIDPVPNDTYRAHIIKSQVKPTKENTGKYLELEFEILDGPFKGRKFWDRLNIQNPNPQTVQIAQGQLSALCHATGVLRLSSSTQLHHIPVLARVVIKQQKGYEPANVVKGYKSANALTLANGVGEAAAPGVQASAPPAAARDNTPPWAQKKPA